MKIILESNEECGWLKNIITDFDDVGKIRTSGSVEKLISYLRESVNTYYINGIDISGPMDCKFCGNNWIAFFPAKAKILQCPKCKRNNVIPKIKIRR